MSDARLLLIAAPAALLAACSPQAAEPAPSGDTPAPDASVSEPAPALADAAPAAMEEADAETVAPAAPTTAGPFQVQPGQGVFLSITDIHFDPLHDPSLLSQLEASPISGWEAIFDSSSDPSFRGGGGLGGDSAWRLMDSAIEEAANLGVTYDYVVYSGDYVVHQFKPSYAGGDFDDFATRTVRFVGQMMDDAFGAAPVFGVLGNNDALCWNYEIEPGSDLLSGIRPQWEQLSGSTAGFSDFDQLGYYKTAHPTVPDMDIIGIDNIFWTNRFSDQCGGGDRDAPGEALRTWLDGAISASATAGRRVQIIAHIPPGADAFTTASNGGTCGSTVAMNLRDDFNQDFLDVLRAHPGTVARVFTGHTHMDNFAVIDDDSGAPLLAVNTTPSVSPIFGNNPGFTLYLYDRSDGAILDSATYYLTNLDAANTGSAAVWAHEYTFTQAYGVTDLSVTQLDALAGRIAAGTGDARDRLVTYYGVSATVSTERHPDVIVCQQTALTAAEMGTCLCGG